MQLCQVSVTAGVPMLFGGTDEPTAFGEYICIGGIGKFLILIMSCIGNILLQDPHAAASSWSPIYPTYTLRIPSVHPA